MNNFSNFFEVQDVFARLFVLAIQNDFHPNAFTYMLERSEFVNYIENGKTNELFDLKIETLFETITSYKIETDTSFGIYNDAYWCGYSYFVIFVRSKKPFSYIFLKLPFSDLLSLYPVYHEMDISQFIDSMEKFYNETILETKLKRIRENRGISQLELAKLSGVKLRSIQMYEQKVNDIDKAQGHTLYKISRVLGCNIEDLLENPMS